ncbi:DNA primase [Streptomyces collinus]|uniref:DNA primase n=1 Tax=Streptomyces collinus TaxID=42684 RepID=UPI003683515A
MNRTALGLAIGAGYLLGRTKKLKMALAVGSVVAGKKLNLTPRAIGELVQQQLRDNPQFKEIGDQLRQDMRGVGKAATGAMAERQINALADRLHGRTADVRDRLSGVAPGGGSEDEESREDSGDDEPRDDTDDAAADEDTSGGGREDREDREDEDTSGARRQERPRKKAAQKAPAKKSSAASTAKKAAAKAPAKKTGAARKTAAKKTASAGSGRSRQEKGGDDR